MCDLFNVRSFYIHSSRRLDLLLLLYRKYFLFFLQDVSPVYYTLACGVFLIMGMAVVHGVVSTVAFIV